MVFGCNELLFLLGQLFILSMVKYGAVGMTVKVNLSFGHKVVILSLSKLNIESKNFFYNARFCMLFEKVAIKVIV